MLVLQTERLNLRWFSANDASFVLELLNEPSWITNIGDRGIRTTEQAAEWIEQKLIGNYRSQGFGFWAVERKSDARLLGLCGLILRKGLPNIDVGYAFSPKYWGHGYATESAKACLRYAEDVLDQSIVLAITSPDNHPSAKVLTRIGMTFDKEFTLDGESHPVHLYQWQKASRKLSPRTAEANHEEILRLINRFFSVFTNHNDKTPKLTSLPHYFTENAVIVNQTSGTNSMTLWEFILPRAQLLTNGELTDFIEAPINIEIKIEGDVAEARCRYQKKGLHNGQPFDAMGSKFFQLHFQQTHWRISSLIWQDDP